MIILIYLFFSILLIIVKEKGIVNCGATFIVRTTKSNITSTTGWGTGEAFAKRMRDYVESYP